MNAGRSVTSSGRPSEPLARLCGSGVGGGAVEIADGDHDPLAREGLGERQADTAGSSRDDGDLAA